MLGQILYKKWSKEKIIKKKFTLFYIYGSLSLEIFPHRCLSHYSVKKCNMEQSHWLVFGVSKPLAKSAFVLPSWISTLSRLTLEMYLTTPWKKKRNLILFLVQFHQPSYLVTFFIWVLLLPLNFIQHCYGISSRSVVRLSHNTF